MSLQTPSAESQSCPLGHVPFGAQRPVLPSQMSVVSDCPPAHARVPAALHRAPLAGTPLVTPLSPAPPSTSAPPAEPPEPTAPPELAWSPPLEAPVAPELAATPEPEVPPEKADTLPPVPPPPSGGPPSVTDASGPGFNVGLPRSQPASTAIPTSVPIHDRSIRRFYLSRDGRRVLSTASSNAHGMTITVAARGETGRCFASMRRRALSRGLRVTKSDPHVGGLNIRRHPQRFAEPLRRGARAARSVRATGPAGVVLPPSARRRSAGARSSARLTRGAGAITITRARMNTEVVPRLTTASLGGRHSSRRSPTSGLALERGRRRRRPASKECDGSITCLVLSDRCSGSRCM